ncbi:MAG: hypothetical protein Q9225_007883 [Loekoesia sp. 1 TL-2023]
MPSHCSHQPGQALPPMRCLELIDYVLHNHESPTTIIICSSRETFLKTLHLSLQADTTSEEPTSTTANNQLHPLLLPTIHQLAASKTVELAFAPNLPHLRAYLASYTPGRSSVLGKPVSAKPGNRIPMLAIYGLLALHRATTEYSVQGLSRSLAVAAEAAHTWGMQLILTEDADSLELRNMEPVVEGERAVSQNCWKEQVPLLNSSITLSSDRAWAGRTVEVGAVVAKWCRITRERNMS